MSAHYYHKNFWNDVCGYLKANSWLLNKRVWNLKLYWNSTKTSYKLYSVSISKLVLLSQMINFKTTISESENQMTVVKRKFLSS